MEDMKPIEYLLHLHSCEQEGITSGMPTPQQWIDAVESARKEYESIKHKTARPSDSDIEKEAKEFTEQNHAKTDMKGAYTYSGYIAGSQRMRDRMNGEMCTFAEWLANEKYALVAKGGNWYKERSPEFIHTANMPTQYTTEQLLQKFRSR